MSRIFVEDFESGSLYALNGVSGATIASGISGLFGTYCVFCSTSQNISKNITATDALYGAFYLKPVTVGSGQVFFTTYNSTQVMIQFKRNNTSSCVEVYAGTTLLATGTIPINVNTAYLFEFYIYIMDAGGRVTTKINGVTDIDFTGDTKPSTQTTISSCVWSTVTGCQVYFDNIILDDAAWIGNTKIESKTVNGAGYLGEWTASAGNPCDCVDEVPVSLTDWIETNTTNALSTFTKAALAGSIYSIKSVSVNAVALFEGAPTPTHIQLAVRSGGSFYTSADKNPPCVTPVTLQNIWEVDPATGVAWTASGVNSAEIGIKATS